MKSLELTQMENLQGGKLGNPKEIGADVACAIAGVTMSIVNPILGAVFGLGCSMLAH
jgi:hypothetical protein